MRIEVTAEDIAAGEMAHCEKCPIALALCRAGFPKAYIDGDSIFRKRPGLDGGWEEIAQTPDAATEFIDAFDNGKPVSPFAFDLEVPEAE